jgi:outer membrane protein assembly factor BamB
MGPTTGAYRAYIGTSLSLLLLAAAAAPAAAEWSMEGYDPAHSGVQPTGVIGPAVQWQYDAHSEISSAPATAYSSLYFGTTGGTLVVLDEDTGALAWTIALDGAVTGTPLVSTATVFVPCGNVLDAIATQNRSVKWAFEAVGDLRGSPVLEGGTIYVVSEDKHVYAVDEYTGALVWRVKLDDVVAATPAVSGLTLVVGTDAGTLYGIHRNDGTVLWQTPLGSAVSSAATIVSGFAIVGTYGGRLHAVSVEDGAKKWAYPPVSESALDPILTTPATDSGLVYFGSDGLYCVEARLGELVWHHPTRDFVRGSPAIADTYAVFGSYDGAIRCVDKATGNLVWQFETGTQLRTGTSIDYDKAYVGGLDGVLYARSILNYQPPVVNGPSTLVTEAHGSVRFDVQAQDPEGNVLTYRWDFGDGNASTERAPLHAYSQAGNYTAKVTVSDGTKSKTLEILVVVQPYQTRVEGGDAAGLPVGVVAASVAGAAVIVVLVVLVLLRRRHQAAPAGTVEWEDAPDGLEPQGPPTDGPREGM